MDTLTSAKTERIAVVFVHGQGEQSPMTDLQELARSVWTADPAAGQGAQLTSEPLVDKEGSDLRRLVGTAPGRVVHFYQFYWADLMRGNRFVHLWAWFSNLMKRAPEEVPRPLWPVRQVAMIAALVVAVWGGALGVATGLAGLTRLAADPLSGFADWALAHMVELSSGLLALIAFLLSAGVAVTGPPDASWAKGRGIVVSGAIAAGLLAMGATAVAALRFTDLPGALATLWSLALLAGGASLVVLAIIPRRRALALKLGLLVGGTSIPTWFLTPPTALSDAGPILMSLTLATLLVLVPIGWRLNSSFLAPVMTDSARMFHGAPVNIGNQNLIRRRGLDLLTYLHEPARSGGYDRIVVLAHSLGTVVAYRVLAHYWGSVCSSNPALNPGPRADLEQAAGKGPDDWQAAVRGAFKDLAESDGSAAAWRISDFVTIGSPLTYAHLLFEARDQHFQEQATILRRYPTAPPQGKALGDAKAQGGMFNVTTWTNLFFPSVGLAKGDIVGGPICGQLPTRLGAGVKDVAITGDPASRTFAHNTYWKLGDEAEVGFTNVPTRAPPPRVVQLRKALRLF